MPYLSIGLAVRNYGEVVVKVFCSHSVLSNVPTFVWDCLQKLLFALTVCLSCPSLLQTSIFGYFWQTLNNIIREPNCRKFPDLMGFVILSTIDHFCNSFVLIIFDLNQHGWFKSKMINRKLSNSVVLFRIDVSYLIQSMAALNHYKDQVKDKVS